MQDFTSKLNSALEAINEYNGTAAEVRAYRKTSKGKKSLSGQNKRAQKRRKKDGGGTDKEHNAHERRRSQREKDGGGNKSCSKCDKTGGRMEEHHPNGYDSDKVETLCTTCHQKTKVSKIKSGMKKAK